MPLHRINSNEESLQTKNDGSDEKNHLAVATEDAHKMIESSDSASPGRNSPEQALNAAKNEEATDPILLLKSLDS